MTLGFDARFMSVPGGLGRYCRELLIEITAQNPSDTFVVIVKTQPHDFPARANIRWIGCAIPWYGIAEQFSLGTLMNAQRDIDLWHIPHWNVPLTLRAPFVMTFHDFIFEDFPTHDHTLKNFLRYKLKWLVWRALLKFNVHRARAIITVSNYVRDQIIARFPLAAKKITVVYPGLSRLPDPTPPPFDITHPFFLLVGNSYPHKNQAILLRLLAAHKFELPEHFYHLTHRDRFSEQLQKDIDAAGFADRIHIVFDASDTTLAWMYAHCRALIFPSFSEGFGIPPLEALSFDAPVIAARTTSLPEILGDHAHWFDPRDSEQLFVTMQTIAANVMGGKNHAAKFTWRDAALSTQKIYKNVL